MWSSTLFHVSDKLNRNRNLNVRTMKLYDSFLKSVLMFCFRLGETCSHIGGLLFKMEAAVRLGYTRAKCTDVPCQWNQCITENVAATPIADIRFYKQDAREKCRKDTKKTRTVPEPATESEQQDLLAALASLGEPIVGLSVFKDHCEKFVNTGPDPSVRNIQGK